MLCSLAEWQSLPSEAQELIGKDGRAERQRRRRKRQAEHKSKERAARRTHHQEGGEGDKGHHEPWSVNTTPSRGGQPGRGMAQT